MTLTLDVPQHTAALMLSPASRAPVGGAAAGGSPGVATELRGTGKTWLGRSATRPSNNQYTRWLRIQPCYTVFLMQSFQSPDQIRAFGVDRYVLLVIVAKVGSL
jgi:hypothetical protein